MHSKCKNILGKLRGHFTNTTIQPFTMDKNEPNSESSGESHLVQQPKVHITAERLNEIRKLVEEAKEQKKTFSVKGYFPVIRSSLLERGWLERIEDVHGAKGAAVYTVGTQEDICTNFPSKREWETPNSYIRKCERMVASRLLHTHDVDFYWSMRRDCADWHERISKNKIVNRFARLPFTSKEGLCLLLQNIHWFNEPGVSEVRFPRCYAVNYADQCASFIEDFRITACVSLLRWFTSAVKRAGPGHLTSPAGRVPSTALHFAVARCNEFTASKKHVDVDTEFVKVWECEWDLFLSHFRLLVHKGEKFDTSLNTSEFADARVVNTALNNIKPYLPQYQLDGVRNLWIMKPSNKCRGKDIQIIKDIDDVIRVMNNKLKYVVQKYIERPLLIYNTKFDIRQWFLVTGTYPLSIWMYRDCYLRFSSKPFTLDNLHESVHLTNHAVQHKYRTEKCDDALPDDKMWDSNTFKTYLREIGQADQWYTKVYPGMRECIVGTMLASQDAMDRRSNTFELFGADFMISNDFQPWLIEINSCPAMGSTTSVTSKMCPRCYEDIIKVVIDRRADPKAETGLFDEIYRQEKPRTPAYLGMTLSVKGEKMRAKKLQSAQKAESVPRIRIPRHLIPMHLQGGPTINNILDKNKAAKEKPADKQKKASGNEGPSVSASTAAVTAATSATKRRKPTGVPVPDSAPVTHKATASPACKATTNRAVSLDRKTSKRNSPKSRAKSRTAASSCSKWVAGRRAPPSATWEQDTVSILQYRGDAGSGLAKPAHAHAPAVLPEIDMKTASPATLLCQNLFTVGHGYKLHYFKPIVPNGLLEALGTQPYSLNS